MSDSFKFEGENKGQVKASVAEFFEQVKEGGKCISSASCKTGLWCVGKEDSGGVFQGVCTK